MRGATFLARRIRLGMAALLVGTTGCTICNFPGMHCDPVFPPQPDLAAIVKVVNDAYRTQGFERPVLFLDTGEVCDSILPPCIPPDGGIFPSLKTQLETDLEVKVRAFSEADFSDPFLPVLTPVLPETGEIGVSILLGRFSVDDVGRLSVTVSVARSGLNGVDIEYRLEPAEDGWIIVESRITAVA